MIENLKNELDKIKYGNLCTCNMVFDLSKAKNKELFDKIT